MSWTESCEKGEAAGPSQVWTHCKRPAESMSVLLAARDRGQAGPTAPARGLTLVRVDYGNPRDPDRLAVPPA